MDHGRGFLEGAWVPSGALGGPGGPLQGALGGPCTVHQQEDNFVFGHFSKVDVFKLLFLFR